MSLYEVTLLVLIFALSLNTYVAYVSIQNENRKRIETVETELKKFIGDSDD